MSSPLSDFVKDSKLDVIFRNDHQTQEQHFESTVAVKHTWEKRRELGKGGGGTVWLEECANQRSSMKLRAVKSISKPTLDNPNVEYWRELEAIFKFSHRKVSSLLRCR